MVLSSKIGKAKRIQELSEFYRDRKEISVKILIAKKLWLELKVLAESTEEKMQKLEDFMSPEQKKETERILKNAWNALHIQM